MDLSFYNQVIATLVETYGIKHILGTPHYPQSHGFIKRQHQGIIFFFLRNYQALILGITTYPPPMPFWVDRTQVRSTTGLTPQYLVHGFMGHSPLSVLYSVPVPQLQLSQDELFAFRFDQLRQRLHNHLSAEHMTAYQSQQQKIIFDKKTGRIDPL